MVLGTLRGSKGVKLALGESMGGWSGEQMPPLSLQQPFTTRTDHRQIT